MKNTVLFCLGTSGSGKSYFIQNVLPAGVFYKLKSATTRAMRPGEADGREYYFRDEKYFETEKFATYLWVNEQFWKSGDTKWLYGVPTFEILNNLGKNFVYDVIQPRYARQMIDWFNANGLGQRYDFKTIFFIPPENSMSIAKSRANMPNDTAVRENNTCTPLDMLQANMDIDFMVNRDTFSPRLQQFLANLNKLKTK